MGQPRSVHAGWRLEISNNRGKRSIKPVVIGRKNWLFSNTLGGAVASAVIYSIVETAKGNRLNPSAIDELLPYSASLPINCRIPQRQRDYA